MKLVQTWGLTITEFESKDFEFGAALTEFKVPYTMTQRFRTTNPAGVDVFDVERAFNSLAYTYISAIIANFEILREVDFKVLPNEDKELLRKAVYGSIAYCVLNNEVWERINTSGITGPNFNYQTQPVNWLITEMMMGKKAHNHLTRAELHNYELYESTALWRKNIDGYVQIVGQFDDNIKIDNLTEQEAIKYLTKLGYIVKKK